MDRYHSLVGTKAKVVSNMSRNNIAQYQIRTQGEIWNAFSSDTFQIGDKVTIVAVSGIGFVIDRIVASKLESEAGRMSAVKR